MSPLERVTSAFIPSSLMSTLQGNRQEGYRGPESTNVPRGDKMDCEDQGFETMKEKKGKDGVNNTLLIYRLQNLLWLLGTWASRE